MSSQNIEPVGNQTPVQGQQAEATFGTRSVAQSIPRRGVLIGEGTEGPVIYFKTASIRKSANSAGFTDAAIESAIRKKLTSDAQGDFSITFERDHRSYTIETTRNSEGNIEVSGIRCPDLPPPPPPVLPAEGPLFRKKGKAKGVDRPPPPPPEEMLPPTRIADEKIENWLNKIGTAGMIKSEDFKGLAEYLFDNQAKLKIEIKAGDSAHGTMHYVNREGDKVSVSIWIHPHSADRISRSAAGVGETINALKEMLDLE
ncbi:MAG: hypothetical protein LBJ94_00495 [Puniceicoccales bacterium]|jgi:hypothetical protein|nr:hypothetical protein [Puniceicoccales bacterium]